MRRKLQEVYVELSGPHNPVFISEKNYINLRFDKYTQKS